MTTTVNVIPAGHHVKVTKLHGATEHHPERTEDTLLNPGDPAATFHVHSTMQLHIEEVAAAEIGTNDERPEQIGGDDPAPEQTQA